MKDETIIKVLHRVLSEKCRDINVILKQISILNHQTENYSTMREEVKEEVRKDLFEQMKHYGWDSWINEIRSELQKEREE